MAGATVVVREQRVHYILIESACRSIRFPERQAELRSDVRVGRDDRRTEPVAPKA